MQQAQSLLSTAAGWWDAQYWSAANPQVLPNRGTVGSAIDARFGSTTGVDSNDPQMLSALTSCVVLPGAANNSVGIAEPTARTVNTSLQFVLCVDGMSVPATFGVAGWCSAAPGAGAPGAMVYFDAALRPRLFGSDNVTGIDTLAIGAAPPAARWWRITWTLSVSGGSSQVTAERSNDATSDPTAVAWTAHGTWTDSAARVPFAMAANRSMNIGEVPYAPGTYPMAGSVRRFVVKCDGATTVDVDASVLTSGGQSTLTALTGQACTLNRSATGRKTVALVRPIGLAGVDDYWEVPDHASLNVSSTDQMTVIWAGRGHAVPTNGSQLIGKHLGFNGAQFPGWGLAVNAFGTYFRCKDGTTNANNSGSGAWPNSVASVYAGVLDATNLTTWQNGTAYAPAARPPLTLTSTNPLQIAMAGGLYADIEFMFAAVFQRALTNAQLSLLTAYGLLRMP